MWTITALTAVTIAVWRTFRSSERPRPAGRKRDTVPVPEQAPLNRERRPTDGRPGLVAAALVVAAFTVSLAQTIVIAVLPAFARELDASTTDVTWTLTAFMLSSAVATPIAGRLGDLFGHRRVLVACLVGFTAGGLVCAVAAQADSLGALIAGRAIQGVGGGVFPLAFGLARSTLPAARVPGSVALLSAMFGIGGAAGMVAAGPVVDGLGTAWLFWGTLGLAFAALAAAPALPAVRPARTGRVDLGGAALLSGALVCLLLPISQGRTWGWASAPVIALFATAAALLAAFAAQESRTADPLVDLRLMRERGQATTNLVTLVVAMAMFGAVTLVPAFVQTPAATGYGFGSSPSGAGLIMLPVALVMLVAGPASARLARRRGARLPLQAGTVCAAAALAVLAAAHDQIQTFYLMGVLIGAGYGLAFASIGILIVQATPPHRTGVATGINTIVRTVGGAIGAQIAAAVLAARTPVPGSPPDEDGYTLGFAAFAVLAVAALAATGTVRQRRGNT